MIIRNPLWKDVLDAVDFASSIAFDPTKPSVAVSLVRSCKSEFGIYPLWLLREVNRTKTGRALPLILVAYRCMRIGKKTSVALTRKVWAESGDWDPVQRHALIRLLEKIPHVMKVISEHRMHWRYRLALGEMWSNPPPKFELEDED